MTDHSELICAYRLDGKGGGTQIDWDAARHWKLGEGAIWLHLDAKSKNTDAWLREDSGLDSFVVDGLLVSETRPRCDWYSDGVLLILRGINLHPGADPEDMISIRIWIEGQRIISLQLRDLMAVRDIRDQFSAGKGPLSTGHLVARMAARLAERMGPVIDDLGDRAADLEDKLVSAGGGERANLREARHTLVDLRRTAIALRRYIAPQRDALNQLSQMDESWLDERVRGRLREAVDRVARITEELDEVRERSAVVQDELLNRISQRMEQTMYVLTVVATVMLPLGFLTGLLGINVGGIPGADTNWAFWAVCGMLAIVVVIEVLILRRLKWL